MMSHKRQFAVALAFGGMMTVGVGGVVAVLVQPFFIGLIVMASSVLEFVVAAVLWSQGAPPDDRPPQ